MRQLHGFFGEAIKAHRKTFNCNNIRDVIDAFILEEQQTGSAFFTEHQLLIVLADLFLAGSETSGKSMEWACLFMILHPEVGHAMPVL